MIAWFLRPVTLRTILMMMGAVSPRAFAEGAAQKVFVGPSILAGSPSLRDELVSAMGGSCPKVTVQSEYGGRCVEGERGCFDDEQGRKALATLKQGCEDGRGGEGAPCLYGLFIRKDGKAVAVCGPRMLNARK